MKYDIVLVYLWAFLFSLGTFCSGGFDYHLQVLFVEAICSCFVLRYSLQLLVRRQLFNLLDLFEFELRFPLISLLLLPNVKIMAHCKI